MQNSFLISHPVLGKMSPLLQDEALFSNGGRHNFKGLLFHSGTERSAEIMNEVKLSLCARVLRDADPDGVRLGRMGTEDVVVNDGDFGGILLILVRATCAQEGVVVVCPTALLAVTPVKFVCFCRGDARKSGWGDPLWGSWGKLVFLGFKRNILCIRNRIKK